MLFMEKKTKILLLTTEYPPGPGGIGSHAFSLGRALNAKLTNVSVVAITNYVTQQQADEFDAMHPEAPTVFRLYNTGVFYLARRVLFILRLHRKEKFSHVILSGFFSLWVGVLLKLLHPSLRTIAVLHGSEINPANGLVRFVTHQAIGAADFLVPVSSFTHQQLPPKLQKHPFRSIPNGIDPLDLPLAKACTSMVLNGVPALLTVGNVTPRKGQQRVIKALPVLCGAYPQLRYHIVGLPTHRDEFQQLAYSLGVAEAVSFHGRMPDRQALANCYVQSDIFMILSENQKNGDVEGFGIVVLEANFYGIPVVGARGCGVEAAVDHGFNGLLVDGDNHQEILQAVKTIQANYVHFSNNAKLWASRHNWAQISESFQEIIVDL